jgi:hypothetical protein
MSAFKLDPENPLIALMLGLTFVHMACQKFSARKHSLVVQVKTWDRCYVFFLIFAQKFGKKLPFMNQNKAKL